MEYAYDQLFAADPNNPSLVAAEGTVVVYAVGDGAKTPLALSSLNGESLANPMTVSPQGYGPAFTVTDLSKVAWDGGGFTGILRSVDGLELSAQIAADAAAASETAAQEAQTAAELAADAASDLSNRTLPPGGATGQVLTKQTNTDYAAGWVTPAPSGGGGGSVQHVRKAPGGVWGPRPTSDSNVVVLWIGADPSPSIVTTGTAGMRDGIDLRFVTP